MNEPKPAITIVSTIVVRYLAYCIAFLVIMSSITVWLRIGFGYDHAYGFIPTFFLDWEGNIPTYFSTGMLVLCAVLSGLIGVKHWQASERFAGHWLFLAFVFFCMSVDEAVVLHERLDEFMGHVFLWTIVGALSILIITIVYLKFLFNLPRETRMRFIVAGCIYCLGAIGFECIGGYGLDWEHRLHNLTYCTMVTIEETLEMVGLLLFIRTFLIYMAEHVPGVSVVFTRLPSSQPK